MFCLKGQFTKMTIKGGPEKSQDGVFECVFHPYPIAPLRANHKSGLLIENFTKMAIKGAHEFRDSEQL